MDRLAISIAEATLLSGIGRDGIYRAIREGKLSAKKVGRRTLIRTADLEAFLAEAPQLHLSQAGRALAEAEGEE